MQLDRFGMVQGYFVPRTDIIAWINQLLKLNITKIEQLGSGAVYCQLIDVLYPGKIPMQRVNWRGKSAYDFMANLKLLQAALYKIGLKKQLDKLARAKEKDNLQFAQWFKRLFDLYFVGSVSSEYNAEERRGAVVIDLSFADKVIVPKVYGVEGPVQNNLEKKLTSDKDLLKSAKFMGYRSPEKKEKSRERMSFRTITLNEMKEGNEGGRKTENYMNERKENNEINDMESKLAMISQILYSQSTNDCKIQEMKHILPRHK